jgi:hypothetical protein
LSGANRSASVRARDRTACPDEASDGVPSRFFGSVGEFYQKSREIVKKSHQYA